MSKPFILLLFPVFCFTGFSVLAQNPVLTIQNPVPTVQNPAPTMQNPVTTVQNPVLTMQNSGPVPGDILISLYADTAGVGPGAPGANQSWDYILSVFQISSAIILPLHTALEIIFRFTA